MSPFALMGVGALLAQGQPAVASPSPAASLPRLCQELYKFTDHHYLISERVSGLGRIDKLRFRL